MVLASAGSSKPLVLKVAPKLSKMIRVSSRKGKKRSIKESRTGSYLQKMSWRGNPFPRELYTEFTYSEDVTVSSTTGVPGTYLFSTNDLYDPNVTGTGHQPRYFDTLVGANGGSAPYKNFRVFGSRISIEAYPTGSDSTSMRGLVGIGAFNTTSTVPSTTAEMRERDDFKVKPIGYWSGGHDFVKMTRYVSNKILFGIKDIKDDDNIVGDNAAGPSKQARWCIAYSPMDDTTSRDLRVNVRITYYAMLFNLNDVADS